MFYAAFPPEFNSGRMYAGPGSGSMRAAAAAWEGLATELQSTVSSYSSVIDSLISGSWVGPSSLNMAAAVTPYLAWMQGTAAQAAEAVNPGHRGGHRLRDRVRRARAADGDRRQPQPTGAAGGDQRLRAEHPGDRGHRDPVRRDVGPRRPGDGQLRRLVGGRLQRDAVHRGAADHQRQRSGQPGGRGDPSRGQPGRQCEFAGVGIPQPALGRQPNTGGPGKPRHRLHRHHQRVC